MYQKNFEVAQKGFAERFHIYALYILNEVHYNIIVEEKVIVVHCGGYNNDKAVLYRLS